MGVITEKMGIHPFLPCCLLSLPIPRFCLSPNQCLSPYAIPTILLLSLPSVYEVSPLSTALTLPDEISSLIFRPVVVKKADLIRLFLPTEGRVQAGAVAEAATFRLELYAELYAVCYLWEYDSIPVGFA